MDHETGFGFSFEVRPSVLGHREVTASGVHLHLHEYDELT